jgi:hypothetical protein
MLATHSRRQNVHTVITRFRGQRSTSAPAGRLKRCTGYLGHPFKNGHVEREKDLLSLLANTGGLVYNQTPSRLVCKEVSSTSKDKGKMDAAFS